MGKTLNKHFYKPDYGAKGEVEKGKFDDALDGADLTIEANKNASHIHTNIVVCADYDHPDDAIDAIASANKTLVVTEAETCDVNFTVPANVTVKFERGGKWAINNGITVTFNGQIDAGLWQIFAYTGTGTLNFGAEATEKFYPQWWGAVADGTTDCSPAIINAIKSLPSTGGMVYLVAGTYRCNSSITFPINTGKIENIRIQGESSGLAAGGATETFGTRIDSYIDGGILFDLLTDNPSCNNIQFRDFECYDREATGTNYGIRAYIFSAGCIVENVGFKLFTTAIEITNHCYYSKFDGVSSLYSRSYGIYIRNCNGVLFNRIIVNAGSSKGLYLYASATHLRQVTILNSYFEGNADCGVEITTAAGYLGYSVNVIGCYIENNALKYSGANVDSPIISGTIQGNYFAGTVSVSITLGYAKNILIQGNTAHSYLSSRCIYSTYCSECTFINNIYHSSAGLNLDVPSDNYFIEPELSKAKLPKLVSKVITITDGDATPDVSDGNIFITSSNTAACEITDLDNPTVGQIVTLIGGSDTNSSTITDGGNFKLSAGMTLGLDDSITLFVKADNNYIELSRSTN